MVVTGNLVQTLLQNSDRVLQSENQDTMSVVDAVSLLPGHEMTRTALYKLCEALTIPHPNSSVIPLTWMDRWSKSQMDEFLLQRLDAYFTLRAEDPLKLVYFVPPTSGPSMVIAICSVTSTYCSTLLIGKEASFENTKAFLTSIFKRIATWPATFCWHRFHTLPIQTSDKRVPATPRPRHCIVCSYLSILVCGLSRPR